METVVFDQTPLAEYLRDEGEDEPSEWVPATVPSLAADVAGTSDDNDDHDGGEEADSREDNSRAPIAFPRTPDPQKQHQNDVDTPPPSPPSPLFAPVGRPMVRKRFRNKVPEPLRVDVLRSASISNNRYSRAVASTISRADNAQFIEQFRYTIITSHLLGPSALGPHVSRPCQDGSANQPDSTEASMPTMPGVILAVASAFVLSWGVSWVYAGGIARLTKKRVVFAVLVLAAAGVVTHAWVRQRWLRYIRQSALAEVRTFVARSQDFDSAASAGIAFIKEVELVSRGYRISAPLPPISRMDDRSQTRRCVRLRTAIRRFFADALPTYTQTANVIKGFAEQLDLEMYYHIHDISDFDVSDALQGFTESEFEDADSLRTLTVVAARFHTIRKMFLCALLALEASGDESDFLRWSTAVAGLRTLNETTGTCYGRLQTILGEVETFSATASSPRVPLSPRRERWRSQLGKLNSLSTGIRGLQAKLALLREESDSTLNEADDISQLGPNLMSQYESIGQDLQLLVQAWEEGKSALASGIDRNEKRLSSLSALISPALSLSGLTSVDERPGCGIGNAEDAMRALTGADASSPLGGSTVGGEPDEEVVFEAVSLPPAGRRKSSPLLSREERIAKMREERERRAEARDQADASRGMLRELEMVINLRPKTGDFAAPTPSTSTSTVS